MKLVAVVLDWAGTTVDFGSVAPARTLARVFARADILVTDAEIRRDMGLPKRDHIEKLLFSPRIRQIWHARRGGEPTADDVEDLYREFVPAQLACLGEYANLIPGVLETVSRLRARGLRIGTTTGYTRSMLDLLLDLSAHTGYRPDYSLAPEDVGGGRPAPFMLYELAALLQIQSLACVAKVGDTPADIAEGLNAGAWSIGVAGTGNGIGLTQSEFIGLSAEERTDRLDGARHELLSAGAHYVVDTLPELLPVLDAIDERLATGETPPRTRAKLG